MKTSAAILIDTNHLEIVELEIPQLKPGQVLVEIKYSGFCHTQLLEIRGKRGKDAYLPHCLGHEGSGIVVDIGPDVQKVKPQDTVILSWIKASGINVAGTIYKWGEKKVNAGAITTFSRFAIISENRITPLPPKFPLKQAALIGCAIPTGFGVIFNTAKPKPGQSLAVFGCGGIGLCAINGASIMGCAPIFAIDINPQKKDVAMQMGATHFIDANQENPIEVIQKICPLDFAIEASGNIDAMHQAIQSIRMQGGKTVIVGNAHHGKSLTIDPKHFNMGKKIVGTWGGDNCPDQHFPTYCRLIDHGRIQIDPLLTKTYSLHELEKAIQDLEAGKAYRPLLDLSL